MPRTSKATRGTVSNTFKGSTNARGEFIHDTDPVTGRWVKSSNLKVVAPEGYVMKKTLSSDVITGFTSTYPDLQVESNTDYILMSQNTLDVELLENHQDQPLLALYQQTLMSLLIISMSSLAETGTRFSSV